MKMFLHLSKCPSVITPLLETEERLFSGVNQFWSLVLSLRAGYFLNLCANTDWNKIPLTSLPNLSIDRVIISGGGGGRGGRLTTPSPPPLQDPPPARGREAWEAKSMGN